MLFKFPVFFFFPVFTFPLFFFDTKTEYSSPFYSLLFINFVYLTSKHIILYFMEYHRISFIHNDTEYSFLKAMDASLKGYELMKACRLEVAIYMKDHELKGSYILTGMAKV